MKSGKIKLWLARSPCTSSRRFLLLSLKKKKEQKKSDKTRQTTSEGPARVSAPRSFRRAFCRIFKNICLKKNCLFVSKTGANLYIFANGK